MGTRADFYIGRGAEAEWLGSIAYDGYSIHPKVLDATTPEEFRKAIAKTEAKRDDFTDPSKGWPWPWSDSHTTDYAYALHEGKVWATRGKYWFDPLVGERVGEPPHEDIVFPDMTARKNVAQGPRSGVLVFRG